MSDLSTGGDGVELEGLPVGTRITVTIDGKPLLFEITGHDGYETQLEQVRE